MSWKATLDSTQVKQLKTALICFSKIGTDLLVEAIPSKLILRSLNTSRSAFACVTFHSSFFDSHAIFESRDVKGSVLIKHALGVMRTPRIKKLVLELDTKDTQQLTAMVESESGLQKTFGIPCMDSEILQATVDPDTLPTHVVVSAKEFSRLLQSFQSNLEEVTILALPEDVLGGQTGQAVQLHSYWDPAKKQKDATGTLHTQIQVNTETAFISYQHTADEPGDVTFNIKDFKVMLSWCLSMDLDMAIRFHSPGAPLLVEPYAGSSEMEVEAQLVLATLLESQAHRADTRRHPHTAGPSSRKPQARTQGLGRTPYVPGDTPALDSGRAGTSGRGRVTHQPAAQTGSKRSRFAPTNQNHPRQPQFDTPPRDPDLQYINGGPSQDHANLQKAGLVSPSQREGGGEESQPGNEGAEDVAMGLDEVGHTVRERRPFQAALPEAPESYQDDDWEDEGPMNMRSRYDPRNMAADDQEDDEEDAIPGTP